MRRWPAWRGVAVALFGALAAVLGGLTFVALAPPQPVAAGFAPGQRHFPANPSYMIQVGGGMLTMMQEPSFLPGSSMQGLAVRYRLLTMPSFETPDVIRVDVASDGVVRFSVATMALDDDMSGYSWSGCRAGGTSHLGARAEIDASIAPLGLKPGVNDNYRYGLDGVHYLLERRTATTYELLSFSDELEPSEQALLDRFAKVAWRGRWYCYTRSAARESARLLRWKFGLD